MKTTKKTVSLIVFTILFLAVACNQNQDSLGEKSWD